MDSEYSPELTEALRLWTLIDEKARMGAHSVHCPDISDARLMKDHEKGTHVPYGYEALHHGVVKELQRLLLQIREAMEVCDAEDHKDHKTPKDCMVAWSWEMDKQLKFDLREMKKTEEELKESNRLNDELKGKCLQIAEAFDEIIHIPRMAAEVGAEKLRLWEETLAFMKEKASLKRKDEASLDVAGESRPPC